MYRWEIAWTEWSELAGFELEHYKGFKTRTAYEKFYAKLVAKGATIIGLIVDGRRVL